MRLSRRIATSAAPFTQASYSYTGNSSFSDEGSGRWTLSLLTSGTLVISTAATVDVHCVGGGGGGTVNGWGTYEGGGGGGGGYTTTSKGKLLAPGSYTITIGTGGSAGYWDSSLEGNARLIDGGKGGTTSALSVSAAGGNGGSMRNGHNWQCGGNGGSGGGAGSRYGGEFGTNGASNGSNAADSVYADNYTYYGGKGQGTNTRDFGDSSGTLRAGGGGGGNYKGSRTAGGDGGGGRGGIGQSDGRVAGESGTANYGGGGGGSGTAQWNAAAGAGGSGIVVIRSAR